MREKRPHILILEDDPAVAAGLEALLESRGLKIVMATTVAEASRIVAGCSPHALILDVSLPDGDGIEFYRRLLGSGRRVPVVFVSGHADERQLEDLGSSTVSFLRKPFEFAELWSALRRISAVE